MNKFVFNTIYFFIFIFLLTGFLDIGYCQPKISPLEFLKSREMEKKDSEGEIYLGKILTVIFPTAEVDVNEEYYPFFTELTDLLKSPLRRNYRLVIKGYSDNSGSAVENMRLSVKRAENLKKQFISEFAMKEDRITTKGLGETDPVASNETKEGRERNRRVEIHIFGDVSEAVRFIEKQEEGK